MTEEPKYWTVNLTTLIKIHQYDSVMGIDSHIMMLRASFLGFSSDLQPKLDITSNSFICQTCLFEHIAWNSGLIITFVVGLSWHRLKKVFMTKLMNIHEIWPYSWIFMRRSSDELLYSGKFLRGLNLACHDTWSNFKPTKIISYWVECVANWLQPCIFYPMDMFMK